MGSVPAQAGDFGFAIQAAKIGRGGTFNPAAVQWYRAEALSVRMDIIQGDQIFPPEVGPVIVPKGAYKDSRYGAGQADLIPRIANGFGALLWALMGNVSSVSGKDADGVSATGVNTHTFNFGSSAYNIPWMAVRRMIPGPTAAGNYGQTFFDGKIANMRLTVPSMGKLLSRITMVSRDVSPQEANPAWTWSHDYEDVTATPEAGSGFLKIAGTEYPITGMVVEFNNGLSTPTQEMIIGDFSPDDFVPLFRSATMRFVYKWEDAGLYRLIFNGGVADDSWTNLPNIFVSAAGAFAFEASFQAPKVIAGSSPSRNYELRIRGNSLVMAPDGPIELAGATILQQSFTATMLYPAGGVDYLQFLLVNDAVGYTA